VASLTETISGPAVGSGNEEAGMLAGCTRAPAGSELEGVISSGSLSESPIGANAVEKAWGAIALEGRNGFAVLLARRTRVHRRPLTVVILGSAIRK